jgi:hypothetical protein
MKENTRNITINILPQDPACWLFIALAVASFPVFNALRDVNKQDKEAAKVKIQASANQGKK